MVAYGRLKTKVKFKILSLKVVAFAYERWLLTRGDLTEETFGVLKSGARFSKLPVITGLVKLFCFPFQRGVSKILKIIQ